MKGSTMKVTTLVTAVMLMATTASAEYATITNVKTNYRSQTSQQPQQRCQDVQVPIYGTRQGNASSGDVLGGAIIGGIIGNQFGNGSGKDAATVLGAILGADAANKNNRTQRVITGYNIQRQCETVYVQRTERRVKNYQITYEWNGVRGQSYTHNNYRVGDQIPISVSINAH